MDDLGTCWILSRLETTLSQIKWMSSYICFVLTCNMGLWDNMVALRWSHNRVGVRKLMCNSAKSDLIHINSDVISVNTLYSTLVFDLATRYCLIKAPRNHVRKKQQLDLDVEFLIIRITCPILKRIECMCLTTLQWLSKGFSIKWHTLLTQ